MKKLLIALSFILASATVTMAQKFAYVDTDYILKQIPEYESAQKKLDEISVQWQKEIEELYAEIDKMYKEFQAEAILLPEDVKRKREEEIIQKEKEAKELQKQRFGYEGELFKKRQELIKPIQDKVFNAIKTYAETRNYAVIFDKSSQPIMLYTNKRYDVSDDILEELGYKN